MGKGWGFLFGIAFFFLESPNSHRNVSESKRKYSPLVKEGGRRETGLCSVCRAVFPTACRGSGDKFCTSSVDSTVVLGGDTSREFVNAKPSCVLEGKPVSQHNPKSSVRILEVEALRPVRATYHLRVTPVRGHPGARGRVSEDVSLVDLLFLRWKPERGGWTQGNKAP